MSHEFDLSEVLSKCGTWCADHSTQMIDVAMKGVVLAGTGAVVHHMYNSGNTTEQTLRLLQEDLIYLTRDNCVGLFENMIDLQIRIMNVAECVRTFKSLCRNVERILCTHHIVSTKVDMLRDYDMPTVHKLVSRCKAAILQIQTDFVGSSISDEFTSSATMRACDNVSKALLNLLVDMTLLESAHKRNKYVAGLFASQGNRTS